MTTIAEKFKEKKEAKKFIPKGTIPVIKEPLEYEEPPLIRLKATDLFIAKKMVQIYTSAGSRNLPFDLDIKTVRKLLNTNKCYFTGEPPMSITLL